MDKIDALKSFDDKKFSKLGSSRAEWLNSGSDDIFKGKSEVNYLAETIFPDKIVVKVKALLKENDTFKTLVLSSLEGEELPPFRAGQKIAVTINVDDQFYTSPYSLSCNPAKANNGEYSVIIKDDENDIVSKYLFNRVKKDEQIIISRPFGDFYYNSLRDEKKVVAIVSDIGIAPIMSMIQAIISGGENFDLTLFYSEKHESDILFKDELLEYAEASNKINVNFVLSVDVNEKMMSGFVSLDKLKNYYEEGKTSFFIAGGEGLLKYLDNELKDLKLPKKFIRYDSYLPKCNIRKVRKYTLTVYINEEKYEVPCYNNKTIMKSLFEAGKFIPSKCQNGTCGYCRSELVFGEVKIVNDKRTEADKKYNYIHPCSTYPLSDIEIIVR